MNLLQAIPREILELILDYCSKKEFYKLLSVSRYFANIIRASKRWLSFESSIMMPKNISIYNFCILFSINFNLKYDQYSEYQKYHTDILMVHKTHISVYDIINNFNDTLIRIDLLRIYYKCERDIMNSIFYEIIQNIKKYDSDEQIRKNKELITSITIRAYDHNAILIKCSNEISIRIGSDDTIVFEHETNNKTKIWNDLLFDYRNPIQMKDYLFKNHHFSDKIHLLTIVVWSILQLCKSY
jgi:hypothetical protein